MEIKPIRTDEDYQAALKEIEAIFDAQPGTPEGDRLEILVILVADYEEKHYPIPLPDPIEAIEFHMERLGLDRKDLEPWIGNRARVSEVLNRKRPLSLRMIRNLPKGLGISMEILVQEYPPAARTGRQADVLAESSRKDRGRAKKVPRYPVLPGYGDRVSKRVDNPEAKNAGLLRERRPQENELSEE